MALKSWLASLKTDVSGVSDVQAPIHAGLGRYVTDTADVSGVSGSGGMVASDTADTAAKNQTYQAQPAWALGCTGDTADTCQKINAEGYAANDLLSGELLTQEPAGPQRIFRRRGPWLTEREQSSAAAYNRPHFNCHQCIAAGRGERYGGRCAVGLALWTDYTRTDTTGDLLTEGAHHGQAKTNGIHQRHGATPAHRRRLHGRAVGHGDIERLA